MLSSSTEKHVPDTDQDDDTDDETTFVSTCHSVQFDAPVSHICNCIYHITPAHGNHKKAINCLAVAGRDGFIRIFESDAPFSSLFAFPIRYERVLSLEFLPKTSSFISVEHTADGSGNHVVIYEDWHRFPNLLHNVQVVEKGEDIIFNFVCSGVLPPNGYIGITSPGNMRLKSFEVEGMNGESSFTFDVKIRTIQTSSDGTIISSNTIVNAPADGLMDIKNAHVDPYAEWEHIELNLNAKSKPNTTTHLVFELRTHSNIRLGPGAYRLSFPVAWKSRSRQRFRRELFGIELCDEDGSIIEAAQQLWIMDSDTATAAAQGYTRHPKYGGKISVCAENIRCLRKSRYIEQMKIFELGQTNVKTNHKTNSNISQSWFPSDFSTTFSTISCMNVCKESGRIVTASKSLISIWDCDLIMRTYRIPHDNYIESGIQQKHNYEQQKVSKYRLGNKIRPEKKKKIRQMITIRTPPLKILSLHASFMVQLLYCHGNYLAFASDHEIRMVHLDMEIETKNARNDDGDEEHYSSGEDDDHEIIIHKPPQQQQQLTQVVALSDTDSNHEVDSTKHVSSSSSMHNVCVVFDDGGRPSIKHHAASFMLIPSIYEFNRFAQSDDKNSVESELPRQSPFQMIGGFADHAHRIDLTTQTGGDASPNVHQTTSLAKKLIGNVVVLDVSPSTAQHTPFDIHCLDYNVIEKEILDRSQAMFDINNISMMVHRRFLASVRIRALQVVGAHALLVATDDEVFVYDLRKRKLSYTWTVDGTIIETYLHDTFLFILTEKDIFVYSSTPRENGQLLLLWTHPLLRMRGLKILNDHKFCLEFGSQTEMDRFSVNADGRRIRSYPFDLRLRLQSPSDPDKRPLTIFEENSPKNILIFEWAPTSEMVLSLITKSHEAMTTKGFAQSRHLLIIALELIKIRKSYLDPLYKSIRTAPPRKASSCVSQDTALDPPAPQMEKKSLGNLISSAWNWMNTNPISSMVIGNASSSLANASNPLPHKQSVIQSEWQMLKQLKKECNGLLADVYVMQNKFDIAAQHYIASNRQFLQIRQLFSQHIAKQSQTESNTAVRGLTLFYRLFLEHKSRCENELNAYTWNYMMQHAKTYQSHSFSTIFLHPFMLNTKFNLKSAMQWLDTCIIHETSMDGNPFDADTPVPAAAAAAEEEHSHIYSSICPSTVTPRNRLIIQATHYLAKVVLLCLKNDIESAQHTLSLMQSSQFVVLLQSHKRLWLEWSHSKTFRRLCCVTFPWEFARIVLEYAIACYNELRSVAQSDSDVSNKVSAPAVSKMEELFPLRSLNFNESLQYFEYESGGPSLMQCYLEGAVRYLVEQIDDFEAIQIETNRCLPNADHALYMKYLAELEEIGFTLIELYVQYLQNVCYEDTTNILMSNLKVTMNGGADDEKDREKPPPIATQTPPPIFERKRHLWSSQYPLLLRAIPAWCTHLLEEEEEKNEQSMVMTRICTLLSCIEFGASMKKREGGALYKKNHKNKQNESVNRQWKRRLDLLLASCPDIAHKYVNTITIIGYVGCGCISDAIHVVLLQQESIVTQFALTHCQTLDDWRILLDQMTRLIALAQEEKNEKQLQYLQDECRTIWRHLARLSSLGTKQSEWLSVMDLISLVPNNGNLEFFAPIFSDLCTNQAGDALNMQLFDRIVQIEKDKDYGFNQQMHEVFYPHI
eukprot:1004664_1